MTRVQLRLLYHCRRRLQSLECIHRLRRGTAFPAPSHSKSKRLRTPRSRLATLGGLVTRYAYTENVPPVYDKNFTLFAALQSLVNFMKNRK